MASKKIALASENYHCTSHRPTVNKSSLDLMYCLSNIRHYNPSNIFACLVLMHFVTEYSPAKTGEYLSIFIQQIVTLSKYGHDALYMIICHP